MPEVGYNGGYTGVVVIKFIIGLIQVFKYRLFKVKDPAIFGETAENVLRALVNEVPS
jgi:hypothetical protein